MNLHNTGNGWPGLAGKGWPHDNSERQQNAGLSGLIVSFLQKAESNNLIVSFLQKVESNNTNTK